VGRGTTSRKWKHYEVFRQLVLARIIEPASKQDSLRVLEEAGVAAPSYPTLNRRLPAWAKESWRQALSEACAAHARLGPASLVLYDVSTLYFEAGQGDGFREPGFSKERRLEPQVTIGLLTGQWVGRVIGVEHARADDARGPRHLGGPGDAGVVGGQLAPVTA
jgi:hypothetical protein